MTNIKEKNVADLTTDNRLLNERESAKLLGVSATTLRQRIRYRGLVKFYRVNRRILYKASDLLDYLDRCKIEPTN
jgi:predicted DNA-binding transcriptional regulator AlpA